jgi:hypothetical protein
MQKHAPYLPCTVTVFWLKYRDSARMLRRLTQPPFIAVPLSVRFLEKMIELKVLYLQIVKSQIY